MLRSTFPRIFKDSFAAGKFRCDIVFFPGIKYNRHCLCEARLVLRTGGFFVFKLKLAITDEVMVEAVFFQAGRILVDDNLRRGIKFADFCLNIVRILMGHV